jgi:crotonobetainyl-CoA hydratase
MSDGIRTATDGAILEVTIDRPKANAIDLAASRRLNEVFTAFRDDPALRVAIVTGAGERFFSPGWDLKGAAVAEESDEDWGVGGFGGLNYPRNLDKPLIAAVNGIACGGGFEVVLGTDIIVMEEHAKFALPEINVGVLADAGTIKPSTGDSRTTSCQRGRPWRRRARSPASSPTGRRCCSRRSSSCCDTRRWSPNTRLSSCTTA